MKQNIIFVFLMFLIFIPLHAQDHYNSFFTESLQTNNTGMYVLGTWAIANLASGAVGWHRGSGSNKYFYQMNLFWNTVNLSIAGISLYSNLNTDISLLSPGEMIDKHTRVEHLYLINAGLDVAYVGTGFLLKHFSTKNSKRADLLEGYGNSIILQGSFLFVFDIVMYLIQYSHRIQFLDNINVAMAPGTMLIKLSIGVQ